MKRSLLFFVLIALFIGGTSYAAELNIYASGLRNNGVNAKNVVTITYYLNATATSLEFQLLKDDDSVYKSVAITGDANLSKGSHTVDINLGTAKCGTYRWAIKATGSTVANYAMITDESADYQFWGGRGVAVDNSFESDYFGNIYVTNYNNGGGDGDYYKDRKTYTGVYAYDAGLNVINSSVYSGGINWGTNGTTSAGTAYRWAIARPCVGPDGTVYIACSSPTNSGVWMMNPGSPSTFSAVFGGTHESTGITKNGNTVIHNLIQHCYVDGLGADRKLYTFDFTNDATGGDILRYDIGTLASTWTAEPSATLYNDANNSNRIQNADCSIAPDSRGGWWICQYRGGTGSKSTPCLIHITNGTIDYNSETTITASYQGGLAVSVDGNTLAIGTTKSNIAIYSILYDSNNKPSLTLARTISWKYSNNNARNAKGLAFDVANNLYVVDNGRELFAAFAIAGSTTFTTPAPSSQAITLAGYPMAGTYTVGGSSYPDFTTLYDAVEDLSSRGISDDVTLLICGDLTESKNIGLSNNSTHSITIRPNADENRTITFTNTGDNDGPSGAFIIGAPFAIPDMSFITTKNICIDGLASSEATHKMTIQVASSFGSNAGPIVFYGDVTNTKIKNCKVVNNMANNAGRAHCITVRATASGYPDGVVIENNEITSTASGYACPIYINGSASTANPTANTIIRNNEITGKRDGILYNHCNNLTIEGNVFRIKGSNGVLGKCIGYYSGTNQSKGNIVIRNNKFMELATNNGYDSNGLIAIEAMSNGNWTIENNLITGFDAVSNSRKGHLIGIKTGSAPTSISIQHNTMIMPALSHSITSSLLSAYPVSLIYIAAGSPVIKNNILVSQETAYVNSLIRGSLNDNCIHNVYYLAGGQGVIVDGAEACANWSAFNTQYPTQAAASAYNVVSFVDDYKLASQYVGLSAFGVDPLVSTSKDIEDNTRNTTKTYAGCYEHTELAPIYDPVAHILPYELRRRLTNDGQGYTFSFKSNIAATSGKLIFYQGGVKKGEVAIASSITAGANEVVVAKTALPQIEGAMTWAVELTGADSKVIGELTDASRGIYNFYIPQGLAVDNSTESDYFGNIYVAEPVDGASDGLTSRSKSQKAGLFVYDPLLNELNTTSNQGYTLGLTLPAANRHGFKRLNVDEQGNVYVNSNEAIYKASPRDFTTSTAIGESKFTAINSFCIDEDVFYVMDNGTALKKLQSGTVTSLFTDASHLVSSNATDNAIIQDGHGGWWIVQSRANADVYYSLLHINASYENDFAINNSTNASILSDCNPKSLRGAIALNHDKTILALGSNSTVIFFDIAYDGAGKPTLTRKPWTLPTLGSWIDGLAFDYADNLYVVSATTERLHAFALPAATNTTCVPAKSTLTVDIVEHVAVTAISLSQTSALLEVGSTLDLTATCTPSNATDKTVEWQSDNTAVAEVNPTTGRVTAVSPGTAHITAVSTADEVESEQCTVTVYTLDFNVTWNTNGASYTTTLLSSNADLWTSFMSGYNAYYTAKGKSSRATQPMTAVATFAYHGVIDLFTDAASPWRWLGTYIYNTAREQSVTLGTETEWTNALQDFFSCTAVHVDFTAAGQTEAWLPLWKAANNYLPRTMRATDEMPTIRKGTDRFEGWYDNSDLEGSAVTSVTEDKALYAKWSSALELDEQATTNGAAIAAAAGAVRNVLLKRHFSVDDGLYTLVLPFDLDNEQLEEAFGVGYKLSVMQTAYFKTSDALYLKFGFVDHLDAGVPCLLRVGTDVTEDILFRDVTIDNAEPIIAFEDVVEMRGLYDMTNVPAAVTNYYLGTDDYLFRYKTAIDTKAFRSYFYFPRFATSAPPRVARVVFREEVATDDLMIEDAPATAAPEKIIRDGEMLIIVDGVEYDMMGRPRVR